MTDRERVAFGFGLIVADLGATFFSSGWWSVGWAIVLLTLVGWAIFPIARPKKGNKDANDNVSRS